MSFLNKNKLILLSSCISAFGFSGEECCGHVSDSSMEPLMMDLIVVGADSQNQDIALGSVCNDDIHGSIGVSFIPESWINSDLKKESCADVMKLVSPVSLSFHMIECGGLVTFIDGKFGYRKFVNEVDDTKYSVRSLIGGSAVLGISKCFNCTGIGGDVIAPIIGLEYFRGTVSDYKASQSLESITDSKCKEDMSVGMGAYIGRCCTYSGFVYRLIGLVGVETTNLNEKVKLESMFAVPVSEDVVPEVKEESSIKMELDSKGEITPFADIKTVSSSLDFSDKDGDIESTVDVEDASEESPIVKAEAKSNKMESPALSSIRGLTGESRKTTFNPVINLRFETGYRFTNGIAIIFKVSSKIMSEDITDIIFGISPKDTSGKIGIKECIKDPSIGISIEY